jgi:hypothetical protein
MLAPSQADADGKVGRLPSCLWGLAEQGKRAPTAGCPSVLVTSSSAVRHSRRTRSSGSGTRGCTARCARACRPGARSTRGGGASRVATGSRAASTFVADHVSAHIPALIRSRAGRTWAGTSSSTGSLCICEARETKECCARNGGEIDFLHVRFLISAGLLPATVNAHFVAAFLSSPSVAKFI